MAMAQRILWIVTMVATIALLFRLWRERLLAHYCVFASYLALSLISAAVLFPIQIQTNTYAYTYFGFEVLFWVFQVLVTLELFTTVLRRYPGLATLGRRVVTFALIFAVAGALLSVSIANTNTHRYPRLQDFYLVSRVVYLSIFLFLGVMIVFLVWFPVPLNRNTVRYAVGYAIYLPVKASAFFTLNLMGSDMAERASISILAIDAACLIYWSLTLRSSGEHSEIIVAHRWNPQEEIRLVQKLDAINTSLLRTAKK